MGVLEVGDEVFGSNGKPCRVVAKSAVKRIGTYVVRFNDGSQVVCDREHLWWVARCRANAPMRVIGVETSASALKSGRRHPQSNWRVPVAEPMELPARDLPLSPYVLGCWLADGTIGTGRISKYQEMFTEIERERLHRRPHSAVTGRLCIAVSDGARPANPSQGCQGIR